MRTRLGTCQRAKPQGRDGHGDAQSLMDGPHVNQYTTEAFHLSATSVLQGRASTRSDEELFAAYQQDGDPDAREALIERFLPFARKLALRYSYTDEPIDDLVQVASLGLLGAIDRFEPGRGNKFTSFAAPTILGELKRHFRDKGWTLHVPRDLQERALALSRANERLSHDLGRSPTMEELAAALQCTVEKALEASEVAHSYTPASLDAPVSREGEESAALVELIGGEDDGFSLAESRDVISSSWRALSDLEREVVALRFAGGLTQREIGQRIGYSQMHVSRLLRRSLSKLINAPAEAA
jgi:RNA polymerase sigma-B factor